jgi:hypothetical protein
MYRSEIESNIIFPRTSQCDKFKDVLEEKLGGVKSLL